MFNFSYKKWLNTNRDYLINPSNCGQWFHYSPDVAVDILTSPFYDERFIDNTVQRRRHMDRFNTRYWVLHNEFVIKPYPKYTEPKIEVDDNLFDLNSPIFFGKELTSYEKMNMFWEIEFAQDLGCSIDFDKEKWECFESLGDTGFVIPKGRIG